MPDYFIKQDYTSGKRRLFPGEILIFSVSFLALSLLFYGGVLYQENIVKSQTAEIQKSIAETDALRDKDKEQALFIFSDQLEKLNEFLKSRLYVSKFLRAIEGAVQPQVVYTDFSIDMDRLSFELKGQAASYGILARQMFKLEGMPVFSSLGLYNTVVQFGGVGFVFRGFLNPAYLK
jgi:hypothetical protein